LTAILVLSNQKDIYSEINNALDSEYVVHFADSVTLISDILVDGIISIVIIDAVFLESVNQKEITDVLSFFPELTLVAAVESGATQHVSLFQNFDIYRYLQKPFSTDQLLNCINAATRKQSKINTEKNVQDNIGEFSKIKKQTNLIFIFIAIISLSFLIYLFLPDNSKEETVVSSPPEITNKTREVIPDNIENSGLLTIEHDSNNLLAKPVLDREMNENNFGLLLTEAAKAINDKHYYAPLNKNALHYYLAAYNIAPDNKSLIDEFNKLNEHIKNEINSFLSNEKYREAVAIVDSIKREYPEYSEINNLEFSLAKKGDELLSSSYGLSAERKYEAALKNINNATLLIPNKTTDLASAKKSIEALIEKRKNFNKLTSIINNRFDSGSIVNPESDSVKFYLEKLKKEDPENSNIVLFEKKLVSELINQANVAIQYNKFEQATLHINEAKSFNLQQDVISKIEGKLEKQEKILRLRKLASNAIEKNNLIYPEDSSAIFYLQSALKIDPENTKTITQIETLVSLLLIQIETDISENTLASANSKINKAKEFGIKDEEIALLESKLNYAINKN
jgi:DNA-binding response OmpR family regulator